MMISNIITDIERPSLEHTTLAGQFGSATLHEASGKRGALSSGIKPLSSSMKICGPAFTVSSPPADNIMLHRAIALAQPGDVLVVEVSGEYAAGYWGDIMTLAAQSRQIQGLVIDGCVRDGAEIVASSFPVFSRGLCIRGTGKAGGGYINHPISIGDVRIMPGDLIVGDMDGVVVVPRSDVEQVLVNAQKREEREAYVRKQLREGKTTVEIYGWELM